MDNERVKLQLLGISQNEIREGARVIILKEDEGEMCLRVVIGTHEAQSIEVKLMGIILPRPNTHDLMASMMQACGVKLDSVCITEFKDGVYKADLNVIRTLDTQEVITLDSRTSDAVALALRTGAPIYVTREILDLTGFNPKFFERKVASAAPKAKEPELSELSLQDLEELLQQHIDNEEYELAAKVQKVIKEKTNN